MERQFNEPEKPKLIEAEIVEDGMLFTTRLRVPGGWFYRSFDKTHGVMAGVFVPSTEGK